MEKQLVLSQKWFRRPSFKMLVQRHYRLLTFTGALIVFLTFILKEGLREHLRDYVAGVDSAESIILAREDTQGILGRLRYMERRIATATEEPAPEKGHDQPRMLLWETDQRLYLSIDYMSRLKEMLPRSRWHDYESMATTYEKMAHALNNKSLTIEVLEERASAVQQLVSAAERRMLWEMKAAREARQKYYDVATWSSYCLYVLGWGLGLVGRIYGVETGGGE